MDMIGADRPFDDLRHLVSSMAPADDAAADATRRQMQGLSLGRLAELAAWAAAWQGRSPPSVRRPLICLFMGSHGVAARSGAPDFVERSQAKLQHSSTGEGAISRVCATAGLGFKVFDLALAIPVGDIAIEPALDEKGCVATMAFGMEAVSGGVDLIGIGEAGIGTGIGAAAIHAALFGGSGAQWTSLDPALGDTDPGLQLAAVEAALAAHRGHLRDPLELLRRLGGREIAAAAGAIIAARLQRVPVVLDGYAVTAAAALLHALDPGAIAHCVAGQVVPGGAHRKALDQIGLRPVLDLELAAGEGVGAALAIGVIRGAVACCDGDVAA